MRRGLKKLGKGVVVLLALAVCLSLLPLTERIGVTAEESGKKLYITSNDMERFNALLNSRKIALSGIGTIGGLVHNIPPCNGGTYEMNNFFSAEFAVHISDFMESGIVSVSVQYGDYSYSLPIITTNPGRIEEKFPGIGDGVKGFGYRYTKGWNKLELIMKSINPTDDVIFSFNYSHSEEPMFGVTAVSSDESMGTTVVVDGPKPQEFLLRTVPKHEGYYFDYWEQAPGLNAEGPFTKIEGSDGKIVLLVEPDKDTTYRAVFGEHPYIWLNFTSDDMDRFRNKFDESMNISSTGNMMQKTPGVYAYKLYPHYTYRLSVTMPDAGDFHSMRLTVGEKDTGDVPVDSMPALTFVPGIGNENNSGIWYGKTNREQLIVSLRDIKPTEDITIHYAYTSNEPAFNVTAIVMDGQEEMGAINDKYPLFMGNMKDTEGNIIGSKWALLVKPNAGYRLDKWQYTTSEEINDNTEWTDVPYTQYEWKSVNEYYPPYGLFLTETIGENRIYRAVFSSSQDRVDIIDKTIGLHQMKREGTLAPTFIDPKTDTIFYMNHYEKHLDALGGNLGKIETRSFQESLPFYYPGANSSSVSAYAGAILWCEGIFYNAVEGPLRVEWYTGDSVVGKPLDTGNRDLGIEEEGGRIYLYGYVEVLPLTDRVTVRVLQGEGSGERELVRRTLPLKVAMTDTGMLTERAQATETILQAIDAHVNELAAKSPLYYHSSKYLMMVREYKDGMAAVAKATSEAEIETARDLCLAHMADALNGIFHQGVQVGEIAGGSMVITTVPEGSDLFTSQCAAMEDAYPGRWRYSCGLSAFGVYFNWLKVYAPDADYHGPYGITVDGGPVSGTYQIWDYTGQPIPTNGVSNQHVWTGLVDGLSAGMVGTPKEIQILTGSLLSMQWDLARLRIIYSDEQLLADSVYCEALSNQYPHALVGSTGFGKYGKDYELDPNKEEDIPRIAAWKALRLKYLDYLLDRETAATRDVVRAIAAITEETEDLTAVRAAYDALSAEEKKGVFNYDDLLAAEFAHLEGNELEAAKIDLKIDAIGEVIYTDECRALIEEARAAYEQAAPGAKALVTKLAELEAAEGAFAAFAAEKTALAVEAINAIPTLEDLKYPEDEAVVKAAREAFNAMLPREQEAFDSALKAKLEDSEARIIELRNAYSLAQLASMHQTTGDWLYNHVTNPVSGSVGGEWAILGLARSEYKPEDRFTAYYNNLLELLRENEGVLSSSAYTEYSRVIIALTSIGKDVTDVGGYNLLKPLADYDKVIRQGLNGPVFALIALDTADYDIPDVDGDSEQTTREKLLTYILEKELDGGGWSYTPDAPADPDMTAMAIQSLAPYYAKNAEVKAAVDRALGVLSEKQQSSGSYASWGEESPESIAQVMTALCALGIDPLEDARFVKDGTLLSALSAYYVEGGGFRHKIDGDLNEMATEQSYYALTAYIRMRKGKTSLYDMSDVIIPTVKVSSVTLPAAVTVQTGETLQLTATVRPSNAGNRELTWTSSDPSVAAVDENGVITGVKSGMVVITAAAKDGSGKSGTCRCSVEVPLPLKVDATGEEYAWLLRTILRGIEGDLTFNGVVFVKNDDNPGHQAIAGKQFEEDRVMLLDISLKDDAGMDRQPDPGVLIMLDFELEEAFAKDSLSVALYRLNKGSGEYEKIDSSAFSEANGVLSVAFDRFSPYAIVAKLKKADSEPTTTTAPTSGEGSDATTTSTTDVSKEISLTETTASTQENAPKTGEPPMIIAIGFSLLVLSGALFCLRRKARQNRSE